MTNWKDKPEGGEKTKSHKSKKGKASAEWKKVENVTNCINSLKRPSAEKRKHHTGGTVVHIRAKRPVSTPTIPAADDGVEKVADNKETRETNPEPSTAPRVTNRRTSTPVVRRPETFQVPKVCFFS